MTPTRALPLENQHCHHFLACLNRCPTLPCTGWHHFELPSSLADSYKANYRSNLLATLDQAVERAATESRSLSVGLFHSDPYALDA